MNYDSRQENEEKLIKSIHKATMENRILWNFVPNEDEPDERKYQTSINGEILEISFLGVHIASEKPFNGRINIISYSIVIISGLKLWIEASSGTKIFYLAEDMVSQIPEKQKIKEINKIQRITDMINKHNVNV